MAIKKALDSIRTIVVARNGILGDTLVALPSLWALRDAFPQAHILYLYELLPEIRFVTPKVILEGTALVDEFDFHKPTTKSLEKYLSYSSLFFRLRLRSFDLGIVLEEPHWPKRRKKFLKVCGINIVVGPNGSATQNPRNDVGRLMHLSHIADTLLDVLLPLGIPRPAPGKGKMDLPRTQLEHLKVDEWLNTYGFLESKSPMIGIVPWSNMPLKRWPLDRYKETIKKLIAEFDVIPIVFGSDEERSIGEELVHYWGRGAVAAGGLGVREGIELLSHCSLYLGNDTGTMHMAVCAGIPCVAIFSARDNPGRWEPYGAGHFVFRHAVPCEGCMLRECIKNKMRCIMSIGVEEVMEACRHILKKN